MKRIFVYYRVSSHSQTVLSQKQDLMKYIESRGDWEVVDEFTDESISGDEFTHRPAYREMIKRVLSKEENIDLCVFWSLSRMGRSLVHIVQQVHELATKANCGIYAHAEKLDTSDGSITGKITLAVLSALNEANLTILRSSIRAGVKLKMEEYRKTGKHWGRPVIGLPLDKLIAMKEQGYSMRKMAKAMECSPATILRRLKQIEAFHKSQPENAPVC